MRMLRGTGALLVLLVLLVGAPLLLLTVGEVAGPTGSSPGEWPAELWALLTGPDDGTFLVSALTLVGWLAWLVLLLSALAETVSLVRGRRLRLPGLAVPQHLVRSLLLAVLALAVVPSVLADASPATSPAPAHSEQQRPLTAPSEQDASTDEQDATPDQVVHEVVAGDDLWSLAEQYYGDGGQWRRIAEANPDRLTGGADHLVPGWRLVLTGVPTPAAETDAVVVVAGDTLSALAQTHLGAAERWPELLASNRAVLPDPDTLPLGTVLSLPPTNTAAADRAVQQAGAEDEADRSRAERAEREHQQQVQQDQQRRDLERAEQQAPPPPPPAPDHDPAEQRSSTPDDRDELARIGVIGSTGGLLAAALVGGVARRRAVQLATRPPGRQLPVPSASAQLVRSALGQHQQALGAVQLAWVQRAIARHCTGLAVPVPPLHHVLVAPGQISVLHGAPQLPPPPGFESAGGPAGRTWSITARSCQQLGAGGRPGEQNETADAEPVAWPALVSLGRTGDGELLVCLQRLGLTSVQGAPATVESVVAALMMELGCSRWAGQVGTTVVGPAGIEFAAAAELTSLAAVPELEPVLRRMERRWAAQRAESADPRVRRLDPTADTAWAPEVLLLSVTPEPNQWRRLQQLLSAGAPVAVIGAGRLAGASSVLALSGEGDVASGVLERPGHATLAFAPQLVGLEVRTAVLELMRVSGTTTTAPAPWWPEPTVARSEPTVAPSEPTAARSGPAGDDDPTLVRLPSRAAGWKEVDAVTGPPAGSQPYGGEPTVLLLGVVELVGARGPAPTRAVKQCIEYCAWLLEHPGRTAPAMAASLVVAEGTRRSNMSRLRRWLGADQDEEPYLPDAYSGRIALHHGVGSDLDELRTLVAGGVPGAPTEQLLAALALVRGAPLADAAPGQWGWAEELRIEILCTLRDVALVVCSRALETGDLDLARWAAARGLTVSPDDERLLAARLRTEHRAGNRAEVERLARRLTRQAKLLEVDLEEETVDLLQQVMEGRIRSRGA